MCKHFPKDTEGIKSYFKQCFEIFDELIKLSRKMEEGYFLKLFFPFQFPKMWAVRNKTMSDLLDDHVRDIKTRSSLSHLCDAFGLPPSRLSGLIYAMATAGFSRSGSTYVKNQSQALSNALNDIVKENGGSVILGTLVERILMKHGRVSDVITADGKEYKSKIVVSNANAPDTFSRFLRTNTIAKEYLKALSKYKPSISSFIVWLGLRGELRDTIPGCNISLVSEMDMETNFKHYQNCDAEKANLSIALYDNYYEGYSRPGTSTMTILLLSGYAPWRCFEKDYFSGNKRDYYREKERITKILIRRTEEKLIPGLSSMIEVMESSTPLTNVRFTKNPEGAIYGYPNSIDNCFMHRFPGNTTPIKGLYLAGGWSKHAGSYSEAMMAGRNVYKLILRDL
jgi:prolycopene isomerase